MSDAAQPSNLQIYKTLVFLEWLSFNQNRSEQYILEYMEQGRETDCLFKISICPSPLVNETEPREILYTLFIAELYLLP